MGNRDKELEVRASCGKDSDGGGPRMACAMRGAPCPVLEVRGHHVLPSLLPSLRSPPWPLKCRSGATHMNRKENEGEGDG